ncbi:MAG: type II toxin-antitoxin system RelB/DinJ family antitoxin [Solobacterium sp.]|nr:type II toxin-antitoxin system RelB/DinJ family antitoxin [Solobacterium sp.]MBR2760872.1 type II toxin-antitoxin system RelB/DinJ family antitoxin [Solobacterium sp.]MBR2768909.1 type II toxin-antitoxin system RelB/DinJ family antitoxin [Solobacterium sp.]MBR2794171.1 type II toxin-antitoxin system RelB/DinJ family antitoxin [Solobacterium sp.]
MEKKEEVNLKVDAQLKRDAEAVLEKLGIPLETAVEMFLNQIILREGIPFPVSLSYVPEEEKDPDVFAKYRKSLL